MKKTVKSRAGRIIIPPTPEEDAAITAAAMSDPDALPMTNKELENIKPGIRMGRPKAAVTKERITIRLSRDVVTQFRATGTGWQTRIDDALKTWLKDKNS